MEKDDAEKKPSATDKFLDKTAETFKWWNHLSTINAEDPIWVGVLKITVRIIGVILLLLISPFVILGLVVAATAAL